MSFQEVNLASFLSYKTIQRSLKRLLITFVRLLTQRNAEGEEKNKGKMDMAVYIFTSAFSLNNIFKTPLPTSTNIHQHVNQDCSLQQVK